MTQQMSISVNSYPHLRILPTHNSNLASARGLVLKYSSQKDQSKTNTLLN